MYWNMISFLKTILLYNNGKWSTVMLLRCGQKKNLLWMNEKSFHSQWWHGGCPSVILSRVNRYEKQRKTIEWRMPALNSAIICRGKYMCQRGNFEFLNREAVFSSHGDGWRVKSKKPPRRQSPKAHVHLLLMTFEAAWSAKCDQLKSTSEHKSEQRLMVLMSRIIHNRCAYVT